MDPIQLTKRLIRISSLTGQEAGMYEYLSRVLSKHGFRSRAIWTAKGRPNLLAYDREPKILFCSHLDTVPPYVGLREDKRYLYGRGACDTKGVIAAQIAAAIDLRAEGHRDIGFLYVVGEEVDHQGAIDVAKKYPFKKAKAIIVGEPTENRLAVATKGIVKVILKSKGKAAHSAYPKLGKSAVHPLLDVLVKVKNMKLPKNRLMGASTLNVGYIQGGVAANVFAEYAEAHVMIRTVSKSKPIYEKIKKICGSKVRVVLESMNDPVQLNSEKGFRKTIVAFNTDAPYLKRIAQKLYLLGPGSILDAHRPDEKIAKKEILRAVSIYTKLVKSIV